MTSQHSVLLTVEEVQRRKIERDRKVEQIEDLKRQIAADDAWLKAALVIMGNRADVRIAAQPEKPQVPAQAAPVTVTGQIEMVDAAKIALRQRPDGLTNQELMAELRKYSHLSERLDRGVNYFYTMISRMAKRGDIRKDGKKLFIANEKGPVCETEPSHYNGAAGSYPASAPAGGAYPGSASASSASSSTGSEHPTSDGQLRTTYHPPTDRWGH